MPEARRVLCVAAHPDDLEVYMGGCLLLLRAGRARVTGIVATDGEKGTRQPVSGTRVDEQRRAFAELGIDARFLGLPDGALEVDQAAARVAAVRAELEPDLVFAPHPDDPHPDHASLGAAVAEPCWRWLPARPPVGPTHFVEIDFSAKARLIRFHASQIPAAGDSRAHLPQGLDILQRAERRDRLYGQRLGLAFAEPLAAPGRTEAPILIRRLEDLFVGMD